MAPKRSAKIMQSRNSRIDVRVQKERLGWSSNSNFLLDQVDTEFCFLYFHDDIIEPTYTERLREALDQYPEAKSAHCDVERFGNQQRIEPGCTYDGTAAKRLVRRLVGPVSAQLLRSLLRSELVAGGLRFPLIAGDGFWRCRPFTLNVIAAGPARRVPEVLYRRWHREGSLTTTWQPGREDALIDGQQQSTALCLSIINNLGLSQAELQLLNFCLFISTMTRTRRHELRLKADRLVKPEVISDAFRAVQFPKDAANLDPEILGWVLDAYGTLLLLEAKHALRQDDRETALASVATAISLNPGLGNAHRVLGKILESSGLKQGATAVRQRLRLLQASERAEKGNGTAEGFGGPPHGPPGGISAT